MAFLLLAGCATPSGVKRRGKTAAPPMEMRVWTGDLRSEDRKNSYQVNIRVKETPVSGICILKKSDDGWRGTLMSEFGAKVFDFVISERKCTLLNVIPRMDKWYIRKTIAADLYFLFAADNPDVSFQRKTVRHEQDGTLFVNYGKKKSITRSPDGTLTMQNLAHHIFYSLRKTAEQ
jgi:hypothetical protein